MAGGRRAGWGSGFCPAPPRPDALGLGRPCWDLKRLDVRGPLLGPGLRSTGLDVWVSCLSRRVCFASHLISLFCRLHFITLQFSCEMKF